MDCFQIGNSCVQVLEWTLLSLGWIVASRMPESYVTCVFIIYETARLFSKVVLQVDIPLTSVSSDCSTSLLTLRLASIPSFSHCNSYMVVSHCGSNLYFPSD